jgi:hypothetical protein
VEVAVGPPGTPGKEEVEDQDDGEDDVEEAAASTVAGRMESRRTRRSLPSTSLMP